MPNINDSFPSNYVKASDLQGKPAIVTIERVEFEAVGREREMKAVVYFNGKGKGLVLNKTNARKITEISGSPLTEEWVGTAVAIYPTETEFGGETVECIRIKAVAKAPRQNARPAPPPPVEDHAAPLTEDDIPF